MVVPTYLRERQSRINSRYHNIQEEIRLQYKHIRKKVFSRFHNFNRPYSTNIDKSTLDFVNKYDFPIEEQDDELIIADYIKPLTIKAEHQIDYLEKPVKEKLNWKRSRIYGNTVSIIVNNGLIVEKVYLTPQGNLVKINRQELGLLIRIYTFLTLHLKLKPS